MMLPLQSAASRRPSASCACLACDRTPSHHPLLAPLAPAPHAPQQPADPSPQHVTNHPLLHASHACEARGGLLPRDPHCPGGSRVLDYRTVPAAVLRGVRVRTHPASQHCRHSAGVGKPRAGTAQRGHSAAGAQRSGVTRRAPRLRCKSVAALMQLHALTACIMPLLDAPRSRRWE